MTTDSYEDTASDVAQSQVGMPMPPPRAVEGEQVRVFSMKLDAAKAEEFREALDALGWPSQRVWLRACIDGVIQQAAL